MSRYTEEQAETAEVSSGDIPEESKQRIREYLAKHSPPEK
jgi:hypothetical protein